MEKEEFDRFTLRAPVELLIEIKVLAARNRRSLNSQLVSMLESAVQEKEKGEAA